MPDPSLSGCDALRVHDAAGFVSRLCGLLARPVLREREALRLVPCASVHTLFMSYAIDVVFLDRRGQVLEIVTLKPWRAAWCAAAHEVLELRAGQARALRIRPGDVVRPEAVGMARLLRQPPRDASSPAIGREGADGARATVPTS